MNSRIIAKWKYYLFPKAIISIGLFLAVGCFNFASNFAYNTEFNRIGFLNIFLFSSLFGQNAFHYFGSFIAIFPASRLLFDELSTHLAYHKMIIMGSKTKYCLTTVLRICLITGFVTLTGCCILLLLSICLSSARSYPLFFVWNSLAFSKVYWNSLLWYVIIHIMNLMIFSICCAILASGIFLLTRNRYMGYIFVPIGYWLSSYLKGIQIGTITLLPSGTVSIIMMNSPVQLIMSHLETLVAGIVFCVIGIHRWLNSE